MVFASNTEDVSTEAKQQQVLLPYLARGIGVGRGWEDMGREGDMVSEARRARVFQISLLEWTPSAFPSLSVY